MPERQDLEKLLVAHLARINRSVRTICRHSGFADIEAEDCYSWVVAKLIEDDYAILRKFEGRSLLATYLSIVVARLVRDWRTERWGRWRSSAEAKRLGPLACRLEALVYREHLSPREAIETIRSSTAAQDVPSERYLGELFHRIPQRRPPRPREVDEQEANSSTSRERTDRALDDEEIDAERAVLWKALWDAISRLTPVEVVMAKMRYFDGLSVADIARALGVKQKPMYRHMERVMGQLRTDLERAGIDRRRLRDFLDDGDRDVS